MISPEQVLHNLHLQLHPKGECKRAFCSHRGIAAKLAPLVHDMIREACAETAEETRERMVAAAVRAVERDHEPEPSGVLATLRELTKLRELHGPKAAEASRFTSWCDECQCSWPCHTAAILEGLS